jgi:hypothetical protein
MEVLKIILVLLISSSSQYFVTSHSYHFGQCPTLEPVSDFSMNKVSQNNNVLFFNNSLII